MKKEYTNLRTLRGSLTSVLAAKILAINIQSNHNVLIQGTLKTIYFSNIQIKQNNLNKKPNATKYQLNLITSIQTRINECEIKITKLQKKINLYE